MKILVSLAALIVIAAGVRATSALLIPLVLALFLAIITFPLVRLLQRRLHRLFAVLITMVTVLIALVGPGALIVTAIRQFASAAPDYEARLRKLIQRSADWLDERNLEAAYIRTFADPSMLIGFVVTTLSSVVTLLSLVFLVVLVSAFMLAETADIADRRRDVLPPKARRVISQIAQQMQTWLWVKTIVSLLTGVAAGLWVAVMGIEFALVWGLIAFLLNYIPNFGSLFASLPPALIALVSGGPLAAVIVLLGYVVINVALGSVLEPYLMGRQVGLSPLVVLVSVVVWGWLWGVAGMLLAVPITMTIKFGLEASEEFRWLARLLSGGSNGAS
jgi:predicted PurR-regulated permease PerM